MPVNCFIQGSALTLSNSVFHILDIYAATLLELFPEPIRSHCDLFWFIESELEDLRPFQAK